MALEHNNERKAIYYIRKTCVLMALEHNNERKAIYYILQVENKQLLLY